MKPKVSVMVVVRRVFIEVESGGRCRIRCRARMGFKRWLGDPKVNGVWRHLKGYHGGSYGWLRDT
jgi:hypothetical protein